MPNIIVKKWEHINSALPNWDTPKGVHVRNKEHYDRLMKENDFIPSNKVKLYQKRKEYVLSEKSREIIKTARMSADKKGNVRLGDRTIKAMKEIGAIKKREPKQRFLDAKEDGVYTL